MAEKVAVTEVAEVKEVTEEEEVVERVGGSATNPEGDPDAHHEQRVRPRAARPARLHVAPPPADRVEQRGQVGREHRGEHRGRPLAQARPA